VSWEIRFSTYFRVFPVPYHWTILFLCLFILLEVSPLS
jgi:hypothetical protein